MKQSFHAIVLGAMLAFVSVLSLGVHSASAAPMDIGHGSNVSVCFTTCMTASLHKEEIVTDTDKDDDEPKPPFYAQFQSSPLEAIEEQHSQEARSARSRQQPPDTVPVYILINVFRI